MIVDKLQHIAEIIDPTAFDKYTKFVQIGNLNEGVMRRSAALAKAEEILRLLEAWSVQG